MPSTRNPHTRKPSRLPLVCYAAAYALSVLLAASVHFAVAARAMPLPA